MRNISSLLKYCPIIECQSVAFKWLFTDWLMTNGFCVVAFDFNTGSLSVCEEVLTEEEEEKKAQKKKQKIKNNGDQNKHCSFSHKLVVWSIFHFHGVKLYILKVHYTVITYFIPMHIFG